MRFRKTYDKSFLSPISIMVLQVDRTASGPSACMGSEITQPSIEPIRSPYELLIKPFSQLSYTSVIPLSGEDEGRILGGPWRRAS